MRRSSIQGSAPSPAADSSLEDLLRRAKPADRPDIEREYERILGSLLDDTHRQSGSGARRGGRGG